MGATLDPRRSISPAVVAFFGGLLAHGIDQFLSFRAGPIPILATAPVVAVLAYVAIHPEVSRRRVLALLSWGAVGSGLAILAFFVIGVQYQLPRPLTGLEMVVLDFAMFLWFVGTLTAAYVAAASIESTTRTGNRRSIVAIIAGPVLQATFVLLVVVLGEIGAYSP